MFTENQLREIIAIFMQVKGTAKEVDEIIKPIIIEAENQLKKILVDTTSDKIDTNSIIE